ncbi:MAG: cytochrome c [Methylotenera sp.]|nr:cytochrome c [Oligoflexia bacterium]
MSSRPLFALISPLLLIATSLAGPPAPLQLVLKGVVNSVIERNGKKIVEFRTADRDYTFDYNQLPRSVQAAVDAPAAKTEIFDLKVPDIGQSQPARRQNCSELPLGVKKLEELATSKDVKSMQDFLQAIPQGSLQSFTLVTNSKSLQKGKGEHQVSPMWPRVLRSSMDGKVTMSFVCDPLNESHGKVEVMYFDDATNEFKTKEFDFGNQAMKRNLPPPHHRVENDPASCIACHAGSTINGKVSLKPNWPEYFTWGDMDRKRGITVYGANDDNMAEVDFPRLRNPSSKNKMPEGYTIAKEVIARHQEKDDFKKFRKNQADNPCFSTLPWAKVPAGQEYEGIRKHQEYYPYTRLGQGEPDYALRPNLRFNDTYGHLMARRITQLLKNSPDYEILKYYLVMEDARCLDSGDETKIEALMGNFKIDRSDELADDTIIKDHKIKATQPVMYALAKKIGMQPRDWTMEFKLDGDSSYRAGIPGGDPSLDLNISEVVSGNVLADLSQENANVRDASKGAITQGVKRQFGASFSCMDDLGGGIDRDFIGVDKKLCDVLRKENEKHIAGLKAQGMCTPTSAISAPYPLNQQVETISRKLDAQSVERGKALVQSSGKANCVSCHSGGPGLPADFGFIPDEKSSASEQAVAVAMIRKRAQDGILGRIKQRLIKDKSMPPPPKGKDLTDADRLDIESYLESLSRK